MPKEIFFEIIAIASCLSIAVISLILYLGEYRRRNEQKFEPAPFQKLTEPEEKSFNLLHRAIKKAENIISNAELQGIKVEATDKLALKKSQELLQKEVSLQMNKAYSEYIKFLEGLKAETNQIQTANQEVVKQRVDAIFERFEQNLGTFLTSTEQKSVQSIELELKSARQLIETYKNEQMAIIDENIISILERTLTLVLAKKIPLEDQVDLVYEALNKAKVEKFIV